MEFLSRDDDNTSYLGGLNVCTTVGPGIAKNTEFEVFLKLDFFVSEFVHE